MHVRSERQCEVQWLGYNFSNIINVEIKMWITEIKYNVLAMKTSQIKKRVF